MSTSRPAARRPAPKDMTWILDRLNEHAGAMIGVMAGMLVFILIVSASDRHRSGGS